jgi:DNA processing protein
MPNVDPKLEGWMRLVRGSPRQANRIAAALGDVSRLVGPVRPRQRPEELNPRAWSELVGAALGKRVQRELAALAKLGWTPLHREDPNYPPLLRDLGSTPPFLALRGDPSSLRRPTVSLVGTRRPTRYGLNMARRIAADLARRGVTIVSGLARGIDAAAHRSALEVGGRTVAVMGTGPDRIYPEQHVQLAEEITEQGALLTELPPGSPPRRQHFPMRNRIVSGLSAAIVVVEGARRSGSLVTAEWALDQGREVLAVPGRAGEPTAEGTLALIRDGAALACCGEDVLRELPEPLRAHLLEGWHEQSEESEQAITPLPPGLDEDCRPLVGALSADEERSLETLLDGLDLPADRVLTALFALELAGLVEVRPGQRYVLRQPRLVGHT